MCRNIKPLFNFEPVATDEEIKNASLQYVRKLSGFAKPSKINEAAFETAVKEISAATRKLIDHLQTDAKPKNRETEAALARERSLKRFPPLNN